MPASDLDPFDRGSMPGRRFVPREGQSEYLHPDYYSGRYLAVALAVLVMVAVVVGLIVLFV